MPKQLPPKFSFKESLEFVDEIVEKVGRSATEVGKIAKTLGYVASNSGTFPAKIAAARQFGLIANEGRGVVNITDLYKRLHIGDSIEKDKNEAILNPKEYPALMERYGNKNLPELSTISAFVENTYDIKHSDAKKIANAFVESMADFTDVSEQDTSEIKGKSVEKESDDELQKTISKEKRVQTVKDTDEKFLDMLGFQIRISVSPEATKENYELIGPVIKAQIIDLINQNENKNNEPTQKDNTLKE
ncbi:hypothetical protein ACWOAN_03210 [Lactococcus taiwanensis]|uniref:hypothetical protein n=1 Tax=Lactococcus taiwanensis TaxID=1151742 RepID=UPI00190742E8|nr:hypothetical protein [Lactococcus taiwanensis]